MPKRHKQQEYLNSYTELVAGIKMASGVQNRLSNYDGIDANNNRTLLTLNRIVLTYLYVGNSIFQTAIQQPILDAISKGMEIDSSESSHEEIEEILEWWDANNLWDVVLDSFTWGRLYGGGGIVINTEQDPDDPLKIDSLYKQKVEFYDTDRWILTTTGSPFDDLENEYLSLGQVDKFWVYGQSIDKSRVLPVRGKKAPSYIRRQLRGWGLSVGESMIRDLNNYLKTDNVLYEILDESKLDVFYVDGLASKLLQFGGTNKVVDRLQKVNELKNYLNAVILDAKDKYEQKTLSFGGLAEVKRENRIGIAGACRMPVTKLFGLGASGFNSGEDDIENYNAMIESEVRAKIKLPIKQMLKIGFAVNFGYVPNFTLKFPSLRILSSVDEENVNTSKTNRYMSMFQGGLLTGEQTMDIMKKEKLITIDIDSKAIPKSPQNAMVSEENKIDLKQIPIKRANPIKQQIIKEGGK